jgi:subtilisin family serine protease
MYKNFKTRLLTSISAITLLAVAHANDAHAQVIDYNTFNRNMSSIYSTMNIMGNWNDLRTTSLQGISGKNIKKLRGLQDQVTAVERQWQSQNNSLNNLSAQQKLAVYNSQSYQDAYAQYLYMTKYVKPLTAKLISGAHLTVTEAKQYADPFAITAIRNTEKATTVAQFINQQTLSLGVVTPPTTVTPTPVTPPTTVTTTPVTPPTTVTTTPVTPPTTVTPTPVTSTVTNLSPIITTNTSNGVEFTLSNVSFSDSASTSVVTTGTPAVTKLSQDVIADVPNNDGTITRTTKRITTTTTTTPKTTVSTVQRTFVDKVYKNVTTVTVTTPRTKTTYSDGREVTTEGTPVTATSAPVKTFIRDIIRTETIETGRNTENIVSSINDAPGTIISVVSVQKTISNTQLLAPIIITSNSEGKQYVTTSYVDGEPISVVVNGTPTVSTATSNNIVDTKNTDGSTTRNTYNITTTTTITPKTTNVTKVRTYTDAIKKDITVTTTTTPVTRNNYSDGTYTDTNGAPVITRSKETKLVSTNTRTETITVSNNTDNITTTSNNAPGVLVSTVAIAAPVISSNDPNMGTPTPMASNDPNFYKTSEFMRNRTNAQINADQAYARGWTGKGVTVAVADTGYMTSHQDLQGQVIASKDYTGKGIEDVHGHGTHVLGTIVGLKNDTGTHGVAYDSKAIVIKIGGYINMVRGKPTPSMSANVDDGARGLAWAADNGATVGNLSVNSTYDKTFTGSELKNKGNGNYVVEGRYNYGAGQYYNMQDPNLWKSVTDKGMVVVNSAGNQGLPVAANPGYFATVTDQSGNLLLGGKMLIVGAVDQDNKIMDWSNRAGHICQQFNSITNTCGDKHRTSDFYILAPGATTSTSINGDIANMQGTSMAAPVVTGGVAIVNQMWPYMKGENIVKLLTTTANKSIPDYNKETHGAGVLDLDKATQPVGAVGIPTGGRTTAAAKPVISNSSGSGSALNSLASTGSLSNVMVVDEFNRDFYVNLSNGITVKDKRKISEVAVQQSGTSYLPFQQSLGAFEQGGEVVITDDLKFGFANSKDVKGDYTSHVSKNWKMDDKFRIRTTMGTIGEKHTWLGNDSSGALAVGKDNKTYFSQIGFDYVDVMETWSIDLGRGYTSVNTTDESMIKKVNTLQSQSMKLGYERNMNDNQKWGITIGVPNYISRGSATVSVPYATTAEGDIVYNNVKANLKTRTPEKNIGLYYTENGETDLDWNIRFSTEYRHNLAGEAGKKGVGFGIQVDKKFWGSCGFGPWLNMKEFCVKMREDEENFKKEYAKKSQVYEDMLSGKNHEAIGWNK